MSILVALGCVVAALLMFFDLVQPAYSSVFALKAQVAGEQAFLVSETQAVQQAQQIISQYQNEGQGVTNLGLALPSGQDIAGALAQVYGLAANNGILIQSVSVGTPTLESGTAPGTLVAPLGTYSLQLAAQGSYESMQNFITGLETNIRIFDLQNFSISRGSQATAGTGKASDVTPDYFTYNITVATYYQPNYQSN